MKHAIDVYRDFLPNLKRVSEDEWMTSCPYPDHKDSKPSFYVNSNNGLFFCHGCGRGGNVKKFLDLIGRSDIADEVIREEALVSTIALIKEISPSVVEQLHRNLLMDTTKLEYLIRQRKLSYFCIRKLLIGYDTSTDRYAIPIKSRTGKFVNIKLHNSKKDPKSLSWSQGAGKPRLYPYTSLLKTSVVICEGELDCLVLHSNQINGITSTAGANSWQPEWNELFKDKYVKIVMDNDKAGIEASKKIAFELSSFAIQIQVVTLPSVKEGKTDVTDFVKYGGDIHKILMEKKR